MNPKQEIEQLTRELEYHNRQYYVLDDQRSTTMTFTTTCSAAWRIWRRNIRSTPRQPAPRGASAARRSARSRRCSMPCRSRAYRMCFHSTSCANLMRASARRSRRRNIPSSRRSTGFPWRWRPSTAFSRAAPRAETDSSART